LLSRLGAEHTKTKTKTKTKTEDEREEEEGTDTRERESARRGGTEVEGIEGVEKPLQKLHGIAIDKRQGLGLLALQAVAVAKKKKQQQHGDEDEDDQEEGEGGGEDAAARAAETAEAAGGDYASTKVPASNMKALLDAGASSSSSFSSSSSSSSSYESMWTTLDRDPDRGYGLVVDHYRFGESAEDVVVIADVVPGSVAAASGVLRVDDILVSVNGSEV
jgi:hypothetical protein